MENNPLSRIKTTKNAPFWCFNFNKEKINVLRHKKDLHVRHIIRSLAVLGPSNTYDIADRVLRVTPSSDFVVAPNKRSLNKYYKHAINGRNEKTKGKKPKIVVKGFPGLIKTGYVKRIGQTQSRNKKTKPLYFLTLKGIFLALGFEYEKTELKQIIHNFSSISLYFAFLKKIMDDTSTELINAVFIQPLRHVIKNSNIFQQTDMRFYFSNIAEYTSHAFSEKMNQINELRNEDILDRPITYFTTKINDKDFVDLQTTEINDIIAGKIREKQYDDKDLIHNFQKYGIETIMNNIFYYEALKEDWYDSLIEFFYKKEKQESFYRDFGYEHEYDLVYKVMRGLHFTYYYNLQQRVPRVPRKRLRRSKKWRLHQAYKNSNGVFSSMH